jgi:hypothetical protein
MADTPDVPINKLLTAPDSGGEAKTLQVNSGAPVQLDELGPMVVNSDGVCDLKNLRNGVTVADMFADTLADCKLDEPNRGGEGNDAARFGKAKPVRSFVPAAR